MEFEFFIGIDVSKNELDFAVRQGSRLLFHQETNNQPDAIKGFLKELKKQRGFELNKAVFCMEHTGIYSNHLLLLLHKQKANICLQAATHIKQSLGNIRGKNDKVDAIRISEYAYDKREKLRLWEPKRNVVQQLANLASARSRLITAKKLLKTPLGEHRDFSTKQIARQSLHSCNHSLKAIEADLERVDKAILFIISTDNELKRLFDLVTSVTGIGTITAAHIIVTTNEFKDISDPKKFACYAGVAPFTEESGKLIRKARVHHMANKKMKTLLHMSAIVALRYNEDLRLFFERKVKQEKKHKMSVINALRNKLILRVFACVNQNRPYEKNYQRLLA